MLAHHTQLAKLWRKSPKKKKDSYTVLVDSYETDAFKAELIRVLTQKP